MSALTEFVSQNELGEIVSRTISQQALLRCPHFILAPEHYREDETCRCTDPEHTEMEEWGYTWKDGRWR